MAALKDLASMLATLEAKSPEDRIKAFLTFRSPNDQRFYSKFMEEQISFHSLQKVSDHSTLVTFAFKVDRFYCNTSNNLHGGAQASIFDICTSLAVQAFGRKDFWLNGGVSRTLNVTYVRPAPEGTELLLECEIVHMGKQLSMTRALLKRKEDGAVVSTCEHNKAAVAMKPGWAKL